MADRDRVVAIIPEPEKRRVIEEMLAQLGLAHVVGSDAGEVDAEDVAVILVSDTSPGDVTARAVKLCPGADVLRVSEDDPQADLLWSGTTVGALGRLLRNSLELLRLREDVEARTPASDTISAGLAHDLRAPLRAIEFLRECVADDLDAGRTQDALSHADEIGGCVRRMSQLVDAVIGYRRAGDVGTTQVLSLTDCARNAVANLRADIALRFAQVTIHDLPDIECDGPRLIQLFQNLIENGLKFVRGASPKVTVEAEQTQNGDWILSVSDNGIGLPQELAGKVFDPFFRLHRPSEIPGSGLGLATCRRIVTQLGGEIWWEPIAEGGSRFRFSLPATSPMEEVA